MKPLGCLLAFLGLMTAGTLAHLDNNRRDDIYDKLERAYVIAAGSDGGLSRNDETRMLRKLGFYVELDNDRVAGVSYKIRQDLTHDLELIDTRKPYGSKFYSLQSGVSVSNLEEYVKEEDERK